MKFKRVVSLVLICMILVSTLAGCAKNEDTYRKYAEERVLRMSSGFDPPETMHGNIWATAGLGTIPRFVHERLFDYVPLPEKTYIPVLGESFVEDGNKITINLRQGVEWNDGTPFTSKDVISQFNLAFIAGNVIWDYMESIEATDEYTVVVTFKKPNVITTQLVANMVMDSPHHIYKEWADPAGEVVANRKPGTDTKWDQGTMDAIQGVKDKLHAFKPDAIGFVGTGPFTLDNVTSSEASLVKNENYWGAENVQFDEVRIVKYTTLESYLNVIMSEGYDFETQGMSPDVYEQVIKENDDLRIVLAPDLGQPSLQFNMKHKYMDEKYVRQAIQYVVNRDLLMLIAEPGSENADLTSSGMIPPMRDIFLDKGFIDSLNLYNDNPEKAEEILTENGWSRGSDGIWLDETGKVVELELTTTSAYPTFFLCGDSIVNQLNEFGLKTTLKAMEVSAYWKYVSEGSAMMSISMRPGHPNYGEPWETYRSFFIDGAADMGFTTPEEKKAGLTNVILELPDGTELNTGELLDELLTTEDPVRKQEITEHFASVINDLAVFMPLVTKYIPNKIYNPYLTGFPEDSSDPLWYGADSPRVLVRLMREGQLYYSVD